MSDLGVYHPDNLVSGDMPQPTTEILIPQGEACKRGYVLGKINRNVPATGTLVGTGNGTMTQVEGRRYTRPGTYSAKCITAGANNGVFDVLDPNGKSLGYAYVNAYSGTGNGTITEIRAKNRYNRTGRYRVVCYEAVANGGKFRVYDPDDNIIGTFEIPAGAGNSFTYQDDEISFTVTDGATDFAVNDTFYVAPFEHDEIAFIINDGSTDFVVDDEFTVAVTVGTKECKIVNSANSDGSEVAFCIASEDVDTTDGDVMSVGYIGGQYNGRALVFGGDDTLEDHIAKLREIGIVVDPSVPIGDDYYRNVNE